jgi:hypothetical protein
MKGREIYFRGMKTASDEPTHSSCGEFEIVDSMAMRGLFLRDASIL